MNDVFVNISPIPMHSYYRELIENPPDKVHYVLGTNTAVPFEEVIFAPKYFSRHNDPLQYKNYTTFKIKNNTVPHDWVIPYFKNPKDLIHSSNRPILQKVPYVIDIDYFTPPWLVNLEEWQYIRFFKKPWVLSSNDIAAKERLKSLKVFLKSEYCKKIRFK